MVNRRSIMNRATKEARQTYFMLVKTTNAWLQVPVKERFKFKENIITPIIEKYPTVKMRFFDSEAFSGRANRHFNVGNSQRHRLSISHR